ncbi:hypothetical protein HMN09_00987900 [Mycena chlorophos]|uniref:Uncharacterized protein n=1 Tax=Mycena chlorophos TaxID=658473 RepID=A0A8H6W5B6_MYCCL|nr:hypothetical protein HMN09_00987900 [Mycena chlorophos]
MNSPEGFEPLQASSWASTHGANSRIAFLPCPLSAAFASRRSLEPTDNTPLLKHFPRDKLHLGTALPLFFFSAGAISRCPSSPARHACPPCDPERRNGGKVLGYRAGIVYIIGPLNSFHLRCSPAGKVLVL